MTQKKFTLHLATYKNIQKNKNLERLLKLASGLEKSTIKKIGNNNQKHWGALWSLATVASDQHPTTGFRLYPSVALPKYRPPRVSEYLNR